MTNHFSQFNTFEIFKLNCAERSTLSHVSYFMGNNLQIKVQYRSDIFDTEESDEETRCNTPEDMEEGTSRNIPEDMEEIVGGKKESTKTKKTKKENKVSDKKRRENLLEIHSTTQKMVRESEIVLPYHRPKQRTLMEFLNRKNVPQLANRRSLKMSMKDINYLKEIEERKKR
ncbi:hypothetical protein Avbf_03940 [Armadillidium vulgare]|nr:hypothetical protein Avbf_03940 [Armadillidium vulgare]